MDVMEEDFETWYRAVYPAVRAALVVVAGDVGAAEDAVADAFAEALHRWPHVRSMESPAGWVFTVARNRLRRHHRRRARELVLLDSSRRDAPAEIPEIPGIHPELWAAVRALPARQRAAIALRYVEDLTQAQVAARIDVAPGTAAALLHQARGSLRKSLEGMHDGSS